MRFLNPAGLWLLLLIPILIIIYIIRARYEEKSVSSTFLWKLSLRFMKKRLPFRKIRKVLLYICQILIVVSAALLVSRPTIVSPAGAKEYVLILDGSASMNRTNEEGVTRFERAVELVKEKVSEAPYGTPITIILAADESVSLVERSESETEIRLALKNAKCGNGDGNLEKARSLAQSICDAHAVTDVVLFSDCEYEAVKNIQVVNVAEQEWNVSVSALTYVKQEKDYIFTATVCSRNADAEFALAISVDGKLLDAKHVSCKKNAETTVTFTAKELKDFKVATVYTDAKDSLEEDNSYSVCKKKTTEIKVLLVSASPFYLKNVLSVMGNCAVTVAPSLEQATLEGYGLYIFDGCVPESLPTDGSVWIFSPDTALADMSVSEEAGTKAYVDVSKQGSSALYSSLAGVLQLDEASVSKYVKIVVGRSWETILECGDDPILFTRRESNGMRTVVFAFDLHDSNLPLLVDYVVLMNHMLTYSVPDMLIDTDYAVSESIEVTVLPLSEFLYVEYPDKDSVLLSTKTSTAVLVPDTVGVYSAVQRLSDGTTKQVDFFVHLPFSEMNDEAAVPTLAVEFSQLSSTSGVVAEDGLYEIWIWVLSALLLLILAEWGIYYYEQF